MEAEVGAVAVVHTLLERRETLAVAESLTGGLIAATLVGIAGVSAVFRGGLVVYATDLKHSLAGVPAELLAERGPVDPDVARALAQGARERCGADWGLASTGAAGNTARMAGTAAANLIDRILPLQQRSPAASPAGQECQEMPNA